MALPLVWLADALTEAGLDVEEHTGWKTRSSPTSNSYNPVGLLNHHTAGSSILYNYPDPPWWTNTRLEDSCNITIKPDGTVAVLNAGYAYDSGQGDPKVLTRVLNDWPIQPPTDTDPDDRILGNPYFIDIEVQHKGDGGPIVGVQRDALIRTNAVICEHMGWNPATRLLGHREWTVRKPDPKWDGFTNPMHQIRADTLKLIGDVMTPEQEAKLDQLIVLLSEVHNVIGIGQREDGAQVLRHTESNLSHYLRQVLPEDTADRTDAKIVNRSE